jgi:hypothetical protein
VGRVTPQQLEDIQRMVALRMSLHHEHGTLSWKQWTEQIRKRLAAVQMWTVDETRPTFKSALELAADAMTLLALVDAAEQADHAAEDRAA